MDSALDIHRAVSGIAVGRFFCYRVIIPNPRKVYRRTPSVDSGLDPKWVDQAVAWHADGAEIASRGEAVMECRIPILMYHSIADEGPPELAPYRVSCVAFQQQMRFLRERGYRSISLEEWAACIAAKRAPGGRCVIITFDDGYREIARNAWPLLAQAELRATVFVVTGRVGGVADWDQVSGDPIALMSWDELRALQRDGNVIGSHCVAHRVLSDLADDVIAADSVEARTVLRRELGREITTIAYPWGKTDARVRRLLAESGYRIGVGVTGGLSAFADDLMLLPRIEIFGDDDLDAFALKIDADNHETTGISTAPAPGGKVTGRTGPAPEVRDVVIPGDDLVRISAQLGRLIDELTAIRGALLHADTVATAPPSPLNSLQPKLLALFTQPVTGPISHTLVPYQEVSPGIRFGFSDDAHLQLTVAPKHNYSASPEACLNTLHLSFSGGGWFSLEIGLAAAEVAGARRYQFGLSAQPSRQIRCRLLLAQQPRDSHTDTLLGQIPMHPDERSYNLSGELVLPDVVEGKDAPNWVLIVIVESDADLDLELNYLSLYFA